MTIDFGGSAGMSAAEALEEADRTWKAVAEAEQAVAALSVTAQAGNGSVTATADGRGAVVDLRFAASTLRYPDADRLAEHLLAAIRQAEREAAARRAELFGRVQFAGVPLSRITADMKASAEAADIAEFEEVRPW
jgi:DNA-binding protein YbaB